MKTLFDYLSKDNQARLIEYAKSQSLPVGQVKVYESYEGSIYSINSLGATAPRQYQEIDDKVYSWRKRIDYIARRVDMQLHHNFEAGIVK